MNNLFSSINMNKQAYIRRKTYKFSVKRIILLCYKLYIIYINIY